MTYIWPLKIGQTGCPETSVRDCHYCLRDNPEEHSPNFLKFKFEMVFEKMKVLELD